MCKKIIKKCILILITVTTLIAILSGCSVNDATRRKLYKQIIKTGELNLDVSADEYEESETVSNAPVPGTTTYYIYRGKDGEKYTFHFMYIGSDEYTYKVKVTMESGNISTEEDKTISELSIGYEYLFEKRKITRRIKLIDSEQNSYFRRFCEKDRKAQYGIKTFSFYQGDVEAYFDAELIDPRIEKLINDNTEGNISNIDLILCTDQGEYKSEEVRCRKYNNGSTLVITAKNSAEGLTEWLEIDGIRINLKK